LAKASAAGAVAAWKPLAQRIEGGWTFAGEVLKQTRWLNDRVVALANKSPPVVQTASGGEDPLRVASTNLVPLKRPTANSGSGVASETVYREVACSRQDYEVRRLVCPSDGGLSRTLPALPSYVSTFYCPSASPVVYSSAPPLSPATTVCPAASARLDVGGWTQ
jgi:hypothetical protein